MNTFLLKTRRLWGKGREISIIDPSKVDEFFTWVETAKAPLEFKALVGLLFSSGGRISEVLKLTPDDISQHGEFTLNVSKKKRKGIIRPCKLHPIAHKLIEELISQPQIINSHQRIFTFTRHTALKRIKKYFGENFCTHSLRHSFISWLIFTQNMEPIFVAKLMNLELDVVEKYAHINVAKQINKLWG